MTITFIPSFMRIIITTITFDILVAHTIIWTTCTCIFTIPSFFGMYNFFFNLTKRVQMTSLVQCENLLEKFGGQTIYAAWHTHEIFISK